MIDGTGAGESHVVVSNHPNVLQGRTVFAGTRVPLDAMLAYRQAGRPLAEFLGDYPTVERWQAEIIWRLADDEVACMVRKGTPAAE